jgi:short subunit dehydrogenase-like uncharacterized protein
MSTDREFDIILYGASGFVGQLTAAYLAKAAGDARIALAGRSQEKLLAVREALGDKAQSWPIIIADASEQSTLDAMAARTQVLVTTVGPYIRYGLPMVAACAAAGTDYADLTGETLFIRESIDLYHKQAADTGARIVNSCGFDSIPSDLTVFALYRQAQRDNAGELTDTNLVVRAFKAGMSAGTGEIAPELDGYWVGPFGMAVVNTRVVRRSNALLGYSYGRRLAYAEQMSMGNSVVAPVAAAVATAGNAAAAALTSRFFHRLPDKLVDRMAPKPGTGPNERLRDNGHYTMETYTTTTTGARYRATMSQKGDPGYKATAVLLGESALGLAFDRDRLSDLRGVLTPAAAMGDVLLDRLPAAEVSLETTRLA